jgi:hypothetical protein
MNHALRGLGRNLVAGLRLALFLPVERLAFRIGLAELVALFVASSAFDVLTDWVAYGPDAQFSWLGLGGELFSAGAVLLVAAALALAFRQRQLALAIPVIAFASYFVVQLAHTAPFALAASDESIPAWAGDAFTTALATWSVAILIRTVAVALSPVHPHRWRRAVAGGLALAAPLALAPALTSTQGWWLPPSVMADGRYPNPASEPVLAAQRQLLDDALSNLEDGTSGETDVYFVAFAGDARDDAIREDAFAAQRVVDERLGTQDRSIALVNSPATLLDTPMATVTNLRDTLDEIGAAIDPQEDVVVVYLDGPMTGDSALAVEMPPLELVPITPGVLRSLLDEAGIQWRVVVVSSCRAGDFAAALASETTVVLASTAGCASDADATRVGKALFGDALSRDGSLAQALEAARAATGASLVVGPAIARKLGEIDRGRSARAAGRTI